MAGLAETIAQWDEAVNKYEAGDIDSALRLFQQNPEQTAKMGFNIGMIYLRQAKYDDAVRSFGETIKKDQHFAAGYFQRGVAHYKCSRHHEALADFEESHRRLRGNKVIDYKQLGLACKLYECEVLVNRALLRSISGQSRQAQDDVALAEEQKVEGRHDELIRNATAAVKRGGKCALYELPTTAIYRPSKSKTANLKKKNFMGHAQVLSSIKDKDTFVGFMGLQDIEDGKRSPGVSPLPNRKSSEEPHKVLYDFTPNTPAELQVSEGQVVMVISTADDGWCTARLKGKEKTGLVPASYLEPMKKSPVFGRKASVPSDSTVTKPADKGRKLSAPTITSPGKLLSKLSPSPTRKLPALSPKSKKAVNGTTAFQFPPPKPAPPSQGFKPTPPSQAMKPMSPPSILTSPPGQTGKPLPPTKAPKPGVAAKPSAKPTSAFASSLSSALKKTQEVTLKLHMDHTRAIRIKTSISLVSLQNQVSSKFELEEGSISLWFKPNGELIEITNAKELSDLWKMATSNDCHATLWVYSAA